MTKNEKIEYLKTIRKYFKLVSLCRLYNELATNKIDYNNLRETINNSSSNRISEERIDEFITFINNYFIPKILTLPQHKAQELYVKNINQDFINSVKHLCHDLEEKYKNDL
jgi:hypothetical protein